MTSFAYDDAGRLLSITRPTGLLTAWTYDDDDQLLTVDDSPLATISLVRDLKSQVTSSVRTGLLSASPAAAGLSPQAFDAASQLTGPVMQLPPERHLWKLLLQRLLDQRMNQV